jgi:hypothetical protein
VERSSAFALPVAGQRPGRKAGDRGSSATAITGSGSQLASTFRGRHQARPTSPSVSSHIAIGSGTIAKR